MRLDVIINCCASMLVRFSPSVNVKLLHLRRGGIFSIKFLTDFISLFIKVCEKAFVSCIEMGGYGELSRYEMMNILFFVDDA
jgi:hypothetical protein